MRSSFFAANRFRAPLLRFPSDAAISLSQLRGRKSLLAVPSLPRSLMGVLTRHGMGGRTRGRVRRREGRGTRNCKQPTTAQPRARFAGANPIDRLPDRCGSFFKKTDRVREASSGSGIGGKGEGGKEKMRLIPSPVICLSPSFTHPRVSAPTRSFYPTPDRIPHLSLCGTMTLWRDHIGG